MQQLKSSLRLEYKALRDSISDRAREEAAFSAAYHLVASLNGISPCCIAGYAAFNKEMDVFPALERLADAGHKLCLPEVTADKSLLFRAWKPGDALLARHYGILAPQAQNPACQPDIILAPLLAFDGEGRRLGYGGGYYDRTIESLRRRHNTLQVIGMAYELQQAESIPAGPHDQKLDAVVTEHGMIRFS